MTVTLHPYLQACPDPYLRLVRAFYWSVTDTDFRHAAYWRDQVEECLRLAVVAVGTRSPNKPPEVRVRRDRIQQEQIGRAMIDGYASVSRKWHRGGCDVPGARL